MAVITNAGIDYLATVANGQTPVTATDNNGQPVIGDQIILANIAGLDTSATPPASEAMPDQADIVDTLAVSRAGLANDSTAVFSAVADASRGDYQFNWIGLYSSEHDVLIAVAHEPLQQKYATAGTKVGNVLNKSMALKMSSAAAVTGLSISIESWQVDYLSRFSSAEDVHRAAMAATFGDACFEDDAGAITGYNVQSGRAVVDGLLVTVPDTNLTALQSEPLANHPFYVYLTVHQRGDINGVNNVAAIETSQTALSSYDHGGEHYHRELIATITAQNTIDDNRASVSPVLMPKEIKDAQVAADQASADAQAATAVAATATATAATAISDASTAVSTANAAASDASTAVSTANTAESNASAAVSTANTAASDASMAVNTADDAVAEVEKAAPPGAVQAFATAAAPAGWLKCNGQAVNRTNYADLFAAIGTTFGHGDGATTFELPDLRGEFIRGWDDSRGVDAGRALGSHQSDELKSHAHGVPEGSHAGGNTGMHTSGDDFTDVVNGHSQSQDTGGDETRPRNVALLYCIKT